MSSFTNLKDMVENLLEFGLDERICQQLKKVIGDLHYYFRSHFKHELHYDDRVKDHCLHFALSDPKEDDYKHVCDHTHDLSCFHCENLKKIIGT